MTNITSNFLLIKQKYDELINLNISSRIEQELKIREKVDSLISDCKLGITSKKKAGELIYRFNSDELSKDMNDVLHKSDKMYYQIEIFEKKLNYKEFKKFQKYKKTVAKLLLSPQGKNEDIERLKKYLTL